MTIRLSHVSTDCCVGVLRRRLSYRGYVIWRLFMMITDGESEIVWEEAHTVHCFARVTQI